MKAFTQMFGYLWPQWPRIIIVVISALVISVLLSMSMVTIIPLLKVMMGEEGLEGWVNRKAAESYYGVQFHVPGAMELTDGAGLSLAKHLLVLDVEEGSLGEQAGIRPFDYIGDVNDIEAREGARAPYTRLLHELATAKGGTVGLTLSRKEGDAFQPQRITLITPDNRESIDGLPWSAIGRLRWQAQAAAARIGLRLMRILPADNKIEAVLLIMIAVTVITFIRCIAKFYQDYLGQKIVEVGINQLRADVFRHLTRMPICTFANERPSDLISRIVRDTVIMGSAIRVMLGKALREPMNAMIMLLTAFLINWQLALVFLCGAPFVLVLLGSFGRKMKKATRHSLVASSQMLAKLQETVTGLRIVKVYNQQEYEQKSFQQINDRLLKQLLKISKVDAATHPVLEVLGMIVGASALMLGMVWVTQQKVEGTEFLLLLGLLGAAAEATRKTSDIWTKIQQANAAAERIFDVLQQPIEIEKPNAVVLPPVRDRIEFRDIVFSYPGAERRTLDGINLVVTAGHNVAIVGANGSGKTTLANLLPRFYDPDSGSVLIDGHDIRDVTLESLRSQIGMVTQQVISFNDTIAANIAYGRTGATQNEIVEAAKRAYAHEFITRLPKGYDAVIGEQGVGLSGGQLQRIVIARAIVKNPAILLFDEATSQIDAESEAKIHEAIQEIMHGRTTFMIAHRFSTVVAADVIVVMNDGRIIAQGRHDELIRTCPVYQALYETQLVR
ncbi:MAG: ABC transporter transmembrane domain-containing protein [Phycisphaerales bacterium]